MTLDSLIDKQSVFASLKAPNKKQLLQELSQALATQVAIDHRVILETLMKREKLGSTGIGQGIAIPHGKLPSISRVYGLFARLAQPVDFDSVDGQPVDVVTTGRHDPCVGLRATPICEAMLALVLIDHFLRNRAQNADVRSSTPVI